MRQRVFLGCASQIQISRWHALLLQAHQDLIFHTSIYGVINSSPSKTEMADRWRSLDVFLHLLTPAILNLIVEHLLIRQTFGILIFRNSDSPHPCLSAYSGSRWFRNLSLGFQEKVRLIRSFGLASRTELRSSISSSTPDSQCSAVRCYPTLHWKNERNSSLSEFPTLDISVLHPNLISLVVPSPFPIMLSFLERISAADWFTSQANSRSR